MMANIEPSATSAQQEVDAALQQVPVGDRLASLVFSIIADDARAATACAALVDVAAMMCRRLSPSDRRALAEHLRREADAVERAWWN